MIIKLLTISIICFILAACSGGNTHESQQSSNQTAAKHLTITKSNGYTKIVVGNPWKKGKSLQTYILVPRDQQNVDNIPQGTIIHTPLKRVLVYSSVHAAALKELGCIYAIKGVCDANYYKIPEITKGLADGHVINAGSSIAPTIEKIVELNPEAIIVSPYQNAGYGPCSNLGIPIIECADYMESDPLGRAEWIKLFGALFGKEQLADSIYQASCTEYNKIKQLASSATNKPSVITESVISGVWFVPGGSSYMAKMLQDAGAHYPWHENAESGSLQLDFNQVLATAQNADFWLIKSSNIKNYSDLKAAFELHSELGAFKNRKVWVCDTENTNLFEEFPFHPEKLLNDFFCIFHPELATENNVTTYYKPLEE